MKFNARKFLKRAVLSTAFAAATLGFYSYEVEPNILKTTTYELQTKKWDGEPALRVAMAADFHVGCPSVSLKRLGEIVERINELKPDIIVLPGDFVTMIGEDRVIGGEYIQPADIAKVLKNLKAPLGVYASLGNHDMMNGPDGLRRELEKNGVQVLDNEAREIKSGKFDFWIAGLADQTTSKPDWKTTEAKITNDAPVILIMHDPGAFLDVDGRPTVSLAGHTHAGQVAIPLLEKHLKNPYSRAPMKYLYGDISENGKELIVTSGIGTSIVPLRFDAVPEIVRLDISSPGQVKTAAAPVKPTSGKAGGPG